jgi:hypothetical protein
MPSAPTAKISDGELPQTAVRLVPWAAELSIAFQLPEATALKLAVVVGTAVLPHPAINEPQNISVKHRANNFFIFSSAAFSN